MRTSAFRFTTVRHAQPSAPAASTLPFDPSALKSAQSYGQSLFKKLAVIHNNAKLSPEKKLEGIKSAVAAFKSSAAFIPDDRAFQDSYPGFEEFRDWITSGARVTVEDIHRKAETTLNLPGRRTLPAEKLVRLTDNLIAYIISNGGLTLREKISSALRIDNIVRKAGDVRGVGDLRRLIAAPVILPDVVFLPAPREGAIDTGPQEDPALEARKRNVTKLGRLTTAYAELLDVHDVQIQAEAPPLGDAPAVKNRTARRAAGTRVPETMEPAVILEGSSRASFAVLQEHLALLSSPTREVLGELRIPEGTTFSDALSKIERKGQALASTIGAGISPYHQRVMIGTALVDVADLRREIETGRLGMGGAPADGNCEFKFPFKIADLRIVEQELKGYLAGEVAHVENVLQGEMKERSTRRSKKTEERLFTATEREETNEKDTSRTDRFQLAKEVAKTVKADKKLEVNGKLEAQYYGPVNVQATLSAGYATTKSSEQSTREAVSYAKDVVERSAQKIIEKVKEERSYTTTEEFEESNRHVLNNVGGAHHVVGVFRWLNEDYRVWMRNVGKRTMFELLLPEPAAFHLFAMTQKQDESGISLKEPVPPDDPKLAEDLGFAGFALTSHKRIDSINYPVWAAAYGAEVAPPPPQFEMRAGSVHIDSNPGHNTAHGTVTVPAGYVASKASAHLHRAGPPAWGNVSISLMENWGGNGIALMGEVDSVPVSVAGGNGFLIAHVVIECEVTPEFYEEWQIKTYNTIVSAYEAKRSEYQNAVAEARAGAGVVIRGTNPLHNQAIIETELKRNAIRLITHCKPLHSTAMFGEQGEFNCCQVMREAPYVKFVEQVFEWRNMVYEFYPYFWADKAHWTTLYNLSDTDPLFQNFLKAGYARVLVPVTPGYSNAAMNFVNLGTPDLNDLASLQVLDVINGMDEDAPTLAPARVSTQADIDLASPGAVIDGVTMAAGDRVLVRRQNLTAENGVYVWNGAAAPMTRPADAGSVFDLFQAVIEVTEGTDGGFTFRQTETDALVTLGVDPVVFQVAAEVINESLLIPTDLTILECRSAGVEPTTMKILGLCETAGVMTPFIAAASGPEKTGTGTGTEHGHGAGHEHEH